MASRFTTVRDRIVGGASDRFLAQGFHRITMDRLAADLGVSKKTLYRHFASKEQLLYAVVTRFMAETAAEVEAIIDRKDQDQLAKLTALMNYMSQRLSMVSQGFFQELERYAPEMWQELQDFRRRRILSNFLKLYRAGRRQRIFATTPDPRLTAQLFLSLVQGVMNPQALARIPFPPSQVIRAIINIFIYGTLADAPRSRSQKRAIRSEVVLP